MGEASFGKYRLIAELGHGGMADVFLAVMAGPAGSGFSKLTVVKRLRQNLAEEPEFVEMLVDEARISARLNHPNVVQTNEVGSVGNQYFLAMEYLDGQPLHRIQHRAAQKMQKALAEATTNPPPHPDTPPASFVSPLDPFPRECQYLVLADALAGLHHAHELADYDGSPLQIVHRDVTPYNIFVTYEGQVKVVDFGIAKAAGRASETRQGVVKGKVRYMAPEQALGQKVDRRADLFSVGIMLWEAATGKRLWQGMEDLNIVQVLVTGGIRSSPREVDPSVPEALDRICRKSLANLEERYATAEEFRLDLEQFLAESGLLVSARRKLGAAVTELFKDKRTEIKAVIERQLAALKTETPSGADFRAIAMPPDSIVSSGHMQLAAASSGAVAISGAPKEVIVEDAPTSVTDAATEMYSSDKRRRATWVIPLIAAAVVMVALGSIAMTRMSKPAQPTATEPTSPAQSYVRVRLSASPVTAKISIDGLPVPTPYDAHVPRDTALHNVHIEATGFEPHTEIIHFDSDVTMMFTLTKAADTSPKSSTTVSTPRPPTPPPVTPPTKPTADPRPPTPSTATSSPVTTTPSAAPATSKGGRLTIDPSDDPWAGKKH